MNKSDIKLKLELAKNRNPDDYPILDESIVSGDDIVMSIWYGDYHAKKGYMVDHYLGDILPDLMQHIINHEGQELQEGTYAFYESDLNELTNDLIKDGFIVEYHTSDNDLDWNEDEEFTLP